MVKSIHAFRQPEPPVPSTEKAPLPLNHPSPLAALATPSSSLQNPMPVLTTVAAFTASSKFRTSRLVVGYSMPLVEDDVRRLLYASINTPLEALDPEEGERRLRELLDAGNTIPFVARYRKALERTVALRHKPAANVIETQRNLVVLDLHRFIRRPGIDGFLAVSRAQSPQRKALAHVLLVLGVYVLGLSNVYDYGLARIRQAQSHKLSLSQLGPRAIARLGFRSHEVGQLHEEKRKIALSPGPAPITDHRGE